MALSRSDMTIPGRRDRGKWLVFIAVVLVLTLGMLVQPAFAAHNARMDVSPVVVEPGGEVTVEGLWNFAETPVELRWGGLDGEVLATVESDGSFGPETITIPDAEPGAYVLVADQEVPSDHVGAKAIPARALIQVVEPGGAAGAVDVGTTGGARDVPLMSSLREQQPPGAAALTGVGLASAVVAIVAGVGVAQLARRRPHGS